MNAPKRSAYSEKLRDPRWQKKRLEVLDSYEFACQGCTSTDKPLNVHHRNYYKGHEPWEYDVEDLVPLCDECHAEEHEIAGQLHDALQALRRHGFLNYDIHRIIEAVMSLSNNTVYPASCIAEYLEDFSRNKKLIDLVDEELYKVGK